MLILLLTYQKSICVKQVRLEIARNVIYDRSENTEKKRSKDRWTVRRKCVC